MKERCERTIRLDPRWNEVQTIDRLEAEAAKLNAQGWHYLGNHVDALLENVVLFFERDLEIPS